MNKFKKLIKYLFIVSVCALAQAESFKCAYEFRGYEAIGSEWFVFPFMYIVMLNVFRLIERRLFDEEL